MPTQVDVPVLGWNEFLNRFDWQQGEHVSLIGPTGQGKTTLAHAIAALRDYMAVFATKPKDPSLDRLVRSGFKRIKEWPPPGLARRVILWPRWSGPADTVKQRQVFMEAIDHIFAAGAWCIDVDELAYFAKDLHMAAILRLLWQQGRSLGISLLGCTQRPSWVPLEMYSQATHLFFWKTLDQRDRQRIGGVGSADPSTIRDLVARLDEYEVLYVHTRTGQLARTKVEV